MMSKEQYNKLPMLHTCFGGLVMASAAQIRANQANARKSTGPRTAAGKAVVAQNAVKHGLRAEQAVIAGEDPGEFEFYRDALLAELAPAGAMESMLAERAVHLAWRLRRAERIQAEVFDAMLDDEATDPVRRLVRSMRRRGAGDDQADSPGGGLALGRVVAKDFGHARVLDRLGLYERRIEYSLYKTMGELQKLRLLRELDPPRPEPTPEPTTPAQESPMRQTNPMSAVSGSKTPIAGAEFAPSPGLSPRFSITSAVAEVQRPFAPGPCGSERVRSGSRMPSRGASGGLTGPVV
jgi:hypothetical protein